MNVLINNIESAANLVLSTFNAFILQLKSIEIFNVSLFYWLLLLIFITFLIYILGVKIDE